MAFIKVFGLFVLTAVAEIVGCYLPYLWLKEGRSAWLLIPAALSLALFAWLLTLHPQAAGRVYAAYGGIYVSVALVWHLGRRCRATRFVGLGWRAVLHRRHGDHHVRAAPDVSGTWGNLVAGNPTGVTRRSCGAVEA